MITHQSNKHVFPHWLASLICLVLFFGVLVIPTYAAHAGQETPTPTPTIELEETITSTPTPAPTPTTTPFPQEWLDNHELTNGVTVGGIVIVVIIIASTLAIIRRKY
jgi:hypothetical protein